MDDILINKASTIEKCMARIRKVYQGRQDQFATNFNLQDVIILNLQRACEAAIDMATHAVKAGRLGVPQSSRDFFVLLEKAGILTPALSKSMQAMVGFRNIAIHDYQDINLEIVRAIVEKHLDDFLVFSAALLK